MRRCRAPAVKRVICVSKRVDEQFGLLRSARVLNTGFGVEQRDPFRLDDLDPTRDRLDARLIVHERAHAPVRLLSHRDVAEGTVLNVIGDWPLVVSFSRESHGSELADATLLHTLSTIGVMHHKGRLVVEAAPKRRLEGFVSPNPFLWGHPI